MFTSRLTWGTGRINCVVYVTNNSRADLRGHELAMRLRAAHAHLRRRSNAGFAFAGMSADQYVLLTALAEGNGATQQELVRKCCSDTATVGKMVSLLVAKGHVTRTAHPEDGRAWKIRLTAQGRQLTESLRKSSCDLRCELTALFNECELRTLIGFLDRIAFAMEPPTRKASQARKGQALARRAGAKLRHPS